MKRKLRVVRLVPGARTEIRLWLVVYIHFDHISSLKLHLFTSFLAQIGYIRLEIKMAWIARLVGGYLQVVSGRSVSNSFTFFATTEKSQFYSKKSSQFPGCKYSVFSFQFP